MGMKWTTTATLASFIALKHALSSRESSVAVLCAFDHERHRGSVSLSVYDGRAQIRVPDCRWHGIFLFHFLHFV